MKTSDDSMNVAGIDIGKHALDVGLDRDQDRLQASNDAEGFGKIIAFLKRWQVQTVGVEATGSYGFCLIEALREAGLEVVQHQPQQISFYRKMQLKRAKNDTIDAVLIARFTAMADPRTVFDDPRLAGLAEKLLYLEQLREDAIIRQGRLDRYRDPVIIAQIKAEIADFKARSKAMRAALLKELRTHPDLKSKLDLLLSIPGIGDYSAIVLIIRLPELAHLDRAKIAALVGVAPFDCDSATMRGQRRIAGGRKTIRSALYLPTLAAATQWNPDLIVFYQRLKKAGKKTKLVVIAAMRKLLNIARAVLIKGEKWTPKIISD